MFGKNTTIPEIIAVFVEERVLDKWINLEMDAIAIGIDEMLDDADAFKNRFGAVNDIDAVSGDCRRRRRRRRQQRLF